MVVTRNDCFSSNYVPWSVVSTLLFYKETLGKPLQLTVSALRMLGHVDHCSADDMSSFLYFPRGDLYILFVQQSIFENSLQCTKENHTNFFQTRGMGPVSQSFTS